MEKAIAGRISSLIGAINVDQTTQRVVDAILQSNVVEGIDGSTLRVLIQLKTYEFFLELGNYLNAIERKEISLIRR